MSAGRPKKIRWMEAAADEFAGILDEIATDSPRAAEELRDQLLAKVELLSRFPKLGAVCSHFPKARQFTLGSYVVYYTLHRDEVVIRAVVHGARLFRSEWLRRQDRS